jgi:hypothetical protein
MTDGPHVSFAPLSTTAAGDLGVPGVCPDFGTDVCLDCPHAGRIARYDCNYQCAGKRACRHALTCPCSRDGWEQRQPTACDNSIGVI